ncbi:MAG: GIY-YIG nuclease family protein [Thermoleophilia bacterium]
MDERKRLLKQHYTLEGRTPGIFRVRNLVTGKVFLGSAIDLNGVACVVLGRPTASLAVC